MSKKQGSSISSALFMEDPVPTRDKKTLTKTKEEFFVKGEDSDILLVNNEGGPFQLNRNTLRETLKDLKVHHNKQIKDLDSTNTQLFRNIVEVVRLLYGSQAVYDVVLKDIHSVFSDVKSVAPGTVGAFFIGCFTDDKFSGPLGCSPKCASSLPPTEGTPGYSSCEDLVLVYSKGTFQSLNEKRTEHCYIYIEDPEFKEFTAENVKQLKESGINSVSLIFGKADGTYGEFQEKLSLEKLPAKAQDVQPKQTTGMSTAGVVFSILMIVLVVLLIIFLIRVLF